MCLNERGKRDGSRVSERERNPFNVGVPLMATDERSSTAHKPVLKRPNPNWESGAFYWGVTSGWFVTQSQAETHSVENWCILEAKWS